MRITEVVAGKRSQDVLTVRPDAPVRELVEMLDRHNVGALVVSVDGASVDGIVSERDVVRALAAHGASALGRTVASAMSTTVVTCGCADSVEELMASMTERRFRHLPVVDDADTLAGIISIGDVVKARLGQLENENQALTEYIHQGR